MTRSRGVVDWWFRDRRTGRIVIGQAPNLTLWIWLVTLAIRLVFDPSGTTGTVVEAIGAGALIAWALDEIVRGVNPWRRLLGSLVLAGQIAALVT